jgi:hypothetical protein
MATETHEPPGAAGHGGPDGVQMPKPNAWPIVLSLGVFLLAAGAAMSPGFYPVGLVVLLAGLAGWVGELLPGRGHAHEPLAEARPRPITGVPGTVEQLLPGMPGHRMRLPLKVHPISAGIKGGLVGGAAMILPALAYGIVHSLSSGQGLQAIWLPVNLLAGMVMPGLQQMDVADLEKFNLTLFLVASVMHVLFSLGLGLLYGVLLPTLPPIPSPLAWGGLLMPLLWTAVTFGLMGVVNPVLQKGVSWPWFIVSQFIFGVAAAGVFVGARRLGPVAAGMLGGAVGGALMPIPAVLWSLSASHGVWYPVNLLAGMVVPGLSGQGVNLDQFRGEWLAAGLAIHVVLSLVFGALYGVLLPKLRPIPDPLATGGMLLPLLWTGATYGLMGVMNPVLQQRVDWFWFIDSQFVFGVAAAIVVVNSEKVHIPPAGPGSPTSPGTPADERRWLTG